MVTHPSERQRYYAEPAVRQKIADFFGGDLLTNGTAIYIAPGTEWESLHRRQRPLEECSSWMNRGAELNRSLWDRESLIAHLDIEYVNFDHPAHPFVAQEQIFEFQRPVVSALEAILGRFHLIPLHLLTGRGHHFVWQISKQSRAFKQLADLGRMSSSLRRFYAGTIGPAGEAITLEVGAAFAGLGLVIEFVVHQIKALAVKQCQLPIELGAIEAGGAERGREVIALDITEYGDPLCSRVVRVPFSVYLKPWQQRSELGADIVEQLPPMFVIPLDGIGVEEGIRIRKTCAKLNGSPPRLRRQSPPQTKQPGR